MRNKHLFGRFMTENEIEFDVPFKVKLIDKKTKELIISKNIYGDSLMLTEDGEHIHSCECGKYIYNLLFLDDELEELYETYYCLEEALSDLKHLADDVADEFYLVLLDDFTGEFVTVHKYVKTVSFKEVTGEQIC